MTCDRCNRERAKEETYWTAPPEARHGAARIVCRNCYKAITGDAPQTPRQINAKRKREAIK